MRFGKVVAAALLASGSLAFAASGAGAATEGRTTVQDASAIERLIAAAGIRPDQYGLMVLPLGAGSLRAEHEPDKPLNPASTMKLVTTHAAMELLGPDYRWITEVHAAGRVEGDVLLGDLIIKGGGDPKLVIEDMTELVGKLRLAGLREIRGDLVIDDSLYAAGPERLEAFDGDDSQPYNVRPYAALMNFKSTRFVIDPKTRAVSLDPPLADVRVVNDVKVLKGRCRPGSTGFSIDDAVGTESRPRIRIRGTQVRACGEQYFYAAALSHRQFIHGFFKAAWKKAGGTFDGSTRVVPGAAKGEAYYRWVSPRNLLDVVRDVNKFSNNVMARMLLLQIAADRQETPATLEDARRVVSDWYFGQGLPLPSLVIENGSGLSRIERISARDLTAVLAHADQGPNAGLFIDSLPQVGIDGTMRARLRRHPVAGNAFIKTGTLRDVRAIAGYVTAESGERYAVALLINRPLAEGARKAQDAVLRWVYQNG
ncbi:MAG: D-alanyl-D-alanine carboxypeptidase/D-alanyl-D-alanine-endopeptidase [Burkholderiaceae bacterium]|nr:D-alanyl-D-alanine carboxypeptidase/D-alanyl-D-alanine-endopeptidase [Burkholderiaceae bacterium]